MLHASRPPWLNFHPCTHLSFTWRLFILVGRCPIAFALSLSFRLPFASLLLSSEHNYLTILLQSFASSCTISVLLSTSHRRITRDSFLLSTHLSHLLCLFLGKLSLSPPPLVLLTSRRMLVPLATHECLLNSDSGTFFFVCLFVVLVYTVMPEFAYLTLQISIGMISFSFLRYFPWWLVHRTPPPYMGETCVRHCCITSFVLSRAFIRTLHIAHIQSCRFLSKLLKTLLFQPQ